MAEYPAIPESFFFCIVAVLGLCLGSFATALIHRLPRGIPWIYSAKDTASCRSACPNCHTVLGARDLVPLFSWLLSRGRCRHCEQKIPFFYPAVELACMVFVLALYAAWGISAVSFILLLTVPFLLAAILIDWEHMILPDDINVALGILSLLYLFAQWQWAGQDLSFIVEHVLAGLVLVAVFALVSWAVGKWKGMPALGMGDIKFLGPAGIFLGMAALPTYLALSGILGLASAVLKGAKGGGKPFPFGPALIISLYIHLFLTGLGFDYTW